MKRSTITVCLINDAAYYTDVDHEYRVDYYGRRSSEQVLLSNKLGHTCCIITITIQERSLHVLHAKNLPVKLPGYGIVITSTG